jgi:hypothetical protein
MTTKQARADRLMEDREQLVYNLLEAHEDAGKDLEAAQLALAKWDDAYSEELMGLLRELAPLKMSDTQRLSLAAYIADYVMEEQARGNTDIDKWMVSDAIEAYLGGAR